MAKQAIKIEGYTKTEEKTWQYIRGAKLTQQNHHNDLWIKGWFNNRHTGLYDKPINIEDISTPHWKIMPIDGKATDDVFFDRLSKGIFNVNLYLRKWSERDYLPTRCRWHDSYGHLPYLYDEQYSRIMRMMGMAGVMIKSRFLLDSPKIYEMWMRILSRLYWYTIEFGLIRNKEGSIVPFGAGIISSPGETKHVLNIEESGHKHKPFNLSDVISTDYIVDDFQTNYFILESVDQLEDAVIKLIGMIALQANKEFV